jgi:hypothetical protein
MPVCSYCKVRAPEWVLIPETKRDPLVFACSVPARDGRGGPCMATAADAAVKGWYRWEGYEGWRLQQIRNALATWSERR